MSKVMNGAQKFGPVFENVLTAALEADVAVMLIGEPGIGKSSFVQNTVENKLGSKVFPVSCNQLSDKADLTGCRTVEENGVWTQVFFPHRSIMDAIEYAEANPNKKCVLFLDEINRTTSDVTSGCLSLVTERRIGNVHVPENVRFIIAGNDKGNVTMLDSASKTRFALFKVVPDARTFLNLDLNLNPAVVKVLTSHPDYILCTEQISNMSSGDDDDDNCDDFESFMDEDDALEQYTNPRTIDAASRWLNAVSPEFIQDLISTTTTDAYGNDSNQLRDILIGITGDTQFTAELINTIADNLMAMLTAGSQQNAVAKATVSEPKCWTDLKGAGTIDEIRNILENNDAETNSQILLYALANSEDNENIIKQITDDVLSAITPRSNVNLLIDLSRQGDLDDDNIQAFLGSGSNLANQFQILLENC